jgi:ribosome biogenesis GTPase
MGRKSKKTKIRREFRKNRSTRARRRDWDQVYDRPEDDQSALPTHERISGKGELSRRRTVIGEQIDDEDQPGFDVRLEVDLSQCRPGRVLAVRGLISHVADDRGEVYQCATRRLLKTLATDQRHVVVAGDRVMFRPMDDTQPKEGMIERVEPRRRSLCRTSRGRQQLIVTNVDQVMIIASAAEPDLKPNLIDRLIMASEKGGVRPVICINKTDLVDRAELQPLVGVYAQMGYDVILLSASSGFGLARFRRAVAGKESVVVGQSGVGKSSLLNAVDPHMRRPVREVSRDSQKGRHTTTTAELLPLSFGGWVVDTPGIRQFQLWDVIPEEVAGFFRDIRPYVSHCRYPDCTHTHEDDCAVKDAVADSRVDERRYESYCHILDDDAP